MNATQDPRSLTYGGAAATAIPSAPAGVQASVPSDSQMEAPDVRPVQQPTAQSSGAAERLSLQQIADNTAPQAVAAPTVVHSGNDWAARKRLENLATAASSITNDRRWGGDGERSQDRQAYQQALALRQGAGPEYAMSHGSLLDRVIGFGRQHPIVCVGLVGLGLFMGPRRLMRVATVALPLVMKLRR